MKRLHDINWFLADPNRLLQMKPFTRGGEMKRHFAEGMKFSQGSTISADTTMLEMYPVSQDLFITEYRPSLHHILINQSIPKIRVVLDGCELPANMLQITQTASFQKLIHSSHVRSLTSNPLEFNLCTTDINEGGKKSFDYIKEEWYWRNADLDLSHAINICKQLGNVGTLFSFDKESGKYSIQNFSYEDGYQIIPNYDEYGVEVARTLFYHNDKKRVLDTYDNQFHYRITEDDKGSWNIENEIHGFEMCPLLTRRGKVAWEYAESSIEMWELMTNIKAINSKRFGTFALVFAGEMDKDSFKKDTNTLIINLSSDTTYGKQDVKTLEYPEPKTLDNYIKMLEYDISLFGSTSFITPSDIQSSSVGGNGIALAMSNDFSLATQSSLDWKKFVNDMVRLHQQGLDLETNFAHKYSELRIGAKIVPWSLETNNTKITNLTMEGTYLSTRTMIEKMPDAAPDEIQRVIDERGALIPADKNKNSEKARNISINKSNEIIDNK